jgi:hypothetical protein
MQVWKAELLYTYLPREVRNSCIDPLHGQKNLSAWRSQRLDPLRRTLAEKV